jgi:hypothetical protein
MEEVLVEADELVVSTLCARPDLRSLRAVAQALRPFPQIATLELQLRVVRRIGDERYPAEDTLRMLQMLKAQDEGAVAKLTAPLLDVLLSVQLEVRACR